MVVADQPFDDVSVGDSEDGDLIPLQSGEDWIAQLDDDISRLASQSGEVFSITALQIIGVDPVWYVSPLDGGEVGMPGAAIFVAS